MPDDGSDEVLMVISQQYAHRPKRGSGMPRECNPAEPDGLLAAGDPHLSSQTRGGQLYWSEEVRASQSPDRIEQEIDSWVDVRADRGAGMALGLDLEPVTMTHLYPSAYR
jgi:hypothetical protein